MAYQIARVTPIHHFSTDAMIGTRTILLPMVYQSKALAEKLSGRLHDAEYEACGDDYFFVADAATGKRVACTPIASLEDDMPF